MAATRSAELNQLFVNALAERLRRQDRLEPHARRMLDLAAGDPRWLMRARVYAGLRGGISRARRQRPFAGERSTGRVRVDRRHSRQRRGARPAVELRHHARRLSAALSVLKPVLAFRKLREPSSNGRSPILVFPSSTNAWVTSTKPCDGTTVTSGPRALRATRRPRRWPSGARWPSTQPAEQRRRRRPARQRLAPAGRRRPRLDTRLVGGGDEPADGAGRAGAP